MNAWQQYVSLVRCHWTPALCVVWEPRRLQVVVKERTSLDPCMIPPEYLTFPRDSYFYVHHTVYRVQCAPHSVHHTVCSVQCTNTVSPVLCRPMVLDPPLTSQSIWQMSTLYCTRPILHCTAQGTVHIVVHNAQCTMHTAHCAECIVHIVQQNTKLYFSAVQRNQ